MAINLRGLCKFNVSLASNVFLKSNFIKSGVRFLYTEQDLGIMSYENSRFVFHNQFVTIEDAFRNKMTEVCDNDGPIYTEDLKAMLHLAQKNENDMTLLNKMIEKYVNNKSTEKFGSYIFGPVVMRMYYYLNQPELALATFDNPFLRSDMLYHASFRVLMCLLYKHNMFKEMRNVYDTFITEKGINFIGRSSVLLYAACLKEGSQDSLDYALTRWKEELNISRPSLRSCSMIALLAIKNNALETALEILNALGNEHSASARSLKLLIYSNMERYLQIVPILQFCVEQAQTGSYKQRFFADVIDHIEDKLKQLHGNEFQIITTLINDIKRLELVDSNRTLEEFLLTPIMIPMQAKALSGRQFRTNRQSRFYQSPVRREREGLKRYM